MSQPPSPSPSSPVSPPYRTTDFYLACYLVWRKIPIQAVEPVGPNRVVFVFDAVPESVILSYYNHEHLVSASFLSVVESIRHTRELLYHALERKG